MRRGESFDVDLEMLRTHLFVSHGKGTGGPWTLNNLAHLHNELHAWPKYEPKMLIEHDHSPESWFRFAEESGW